MHSTVSVRMIHLVRQFSWLLPWKYSGALWWLESNNFGQQFITYLNFDILMRFSSNSLFPCFVWKNSQQILSANSYLSLRTENGYPAAYNAIVWYSVAVFHIYSTAFCFIGRNKAQTVNAFGSLAARANSWSLT